MEAGAKLLTSESDDGAIIGCHSVRKYRLSTFCKLIIKKHGRLGGKSASLSYMFL